MMKTKILFISIILTCLSTFTFSATITGTVADNSTGGSINGAEVKLYKGGINIRTEKTNSVGIFEFKDLDAGPYNVKINKKGYGEYFQKNIIIEDNDFHKMTIFMDTEVIAVNEPVVLLEKKEAIIEELVFMDAECDEIAYYKVDRSHSKIMSPNASVGSGYVGDNHVEHNTESYDYIDENSFKDAINDPLSTFSIDVDRASYANVRRFINNSQMPYADAVRVEEMINYFDYDYENPNGIHPFGTHLEIGDCPWNPESKLLMIGIQGEEVATEDIPPCNLVFLLDVSGSMNSSNKLGLLKKSFGILVDKLRPQDRVSIVVYAGAAGCVLPSTSGKDKAKILASLDELSAGGSICFLFHH